MLGLQNGPLITNPHDAFSWESNSLLTQISSYNPTTGNAILPGFQACCSPKISSNGSLRFKVADKAQNKRESQIWYPTHECYCLIPHSLYNACTVIH